MTYEEVSKEYMQVYYTCEEFKGKMINEITKIFDDFITHSRDGHVIQYDRRKHRVDGPMTYFRILKKYGEIHISYNEFADDISYPINHFNLGQVKFIYEVLYHKFYDVTK